MRYINLKTGATIETDSILKGAWEEYDPSKQPKDLGEKKQEENKDQIKDSSDLTISEIKQELDAFGVEYPKKATKAELLEIIENLKG